MMLLDMLCFFIVIVMTLFMLYNMTNKEVKNRLFLILTIIFVVNYFINDTFLSVVVIKSYHFMFKALFLVFALIAKILILTRFLHKFSHYHLRVDLLYVMLVLKLSYVIRLFVLKVIFGNINDLIDSMISIMIIFTSYCLLIKILIIRPRQLILSEEEQELGESQDILETQDKILLFSNLFFIVVYLLNHLERLRNFIAPVKTFDLCYRLVIEAFMIALILYTFNVKFKEWKVKKLLKYKEYTLLNLNNYVKNVDESYQSIRAFRHDFSNILISMRDTIETQGIEEIRNTYQEMLARNNILLEKNQNEVAKLSNIKVLELKSVISDKILKAKRRRINVTLEISEVIYQSGVNKSDIVRIIGILLDNAVEATAEIERDYPIVRIAIFNKGSKMYYVIENEMVTKSLPIKKILQNDYSTKGNHRGCGLYNMIRILNRYRNVNYSIQAQDYKFKVELEIELTES